MKILLDLIQFTHIPKIGDYVLVQFPVGNKEYRYVAIVNQIDNGEGELTVTFIKICDDTGHTFKVDEDDVSDDVVYKFLCGAIVLDLPSDLGIEHVTGGLDLLLPQCQMWAAETMGKKEQWSGEVS
ncbi:hypothetical protein RN001_005437 [Aquatica leii]|uniref:Uncharacterized protein n=1 Tax=Aquatica leii TaxID=1421715 RepID=A0AAN7SPV1_9COLE|nr:hypothetical protein RN001_005437 [Aquatica leii]